MTRTFRQQLMDLAARRCTCSRGTVRDFLATKQITMLEHPAYSPDLTPSDFFLFQKIKEILKGRHFDDIDEIRSNIKAALKATPQNHFQNCFEVWTRRWHRCIAPKRSTLKTTTVEFSDEVCSTFTAMSSRTLVKPKAYRELALHAHPLCCLSQLA